MERIDIRIEELNKKLEELNKKLGVLKEKQLKYEEELKNDQKYIEAKKYMDGEYQIPVYRPVSSSDNLSWDEVAKLPTETINGKEYHMVQYSTTKSDYFWLKEHKPDLFEYYEEISSKSLFETIYKLEKEIKNIDNMINNLKIQQENEKENKYDQLLGVKISGEHEIQIIDEKGMPHITRKSKEELNNEIGKLRIKINEMEISGQIDENLKKELWAYVDSKYKKIIDENEKIGSSKYDDKYKEVFGNDSEIRGRHM